MEKKNIDGRGLTKSNNIHCANACFLSQLPGTVEYATIVSFFSCTVSTVGNGFATGESTTLRLFMLSAMSESVSSTTGTPFVSVSIRIW